MRALGKAGFHGLVPMRRESVQRRTRDREEAVPAQSVACKLCDFEAFYNDNFKFASSFLRAYRKCAW